MNDKFNILENKCQRDQRHGAMLQSIKHKHTHSYISMYIQYIGNTYRQRSIQRTYKS